MQPHPAVITTTSFIRTTHHDTTLPHPRPPRPAVQGPATVRAKTQTPVTREGALAALLVVLRAFALITLVDVLRVAARSGGEWNLVTHPHVTGGAPWLGLRRGYTLLVSLAPEDLITFDTAGVYVNARTTVDLLLEDRRATPAGITPASLGVLARSVADGGALVIEGPGDVECPPAWSIAVLARDVADALAPLEAWGADMGREATVRTRPGPWGAAELLVDGVGWTIAVEALPEAPAGALTVRLPIAVEMDAPEAWPTVEELPPGVYAVVGEVG